MKTQNKNHRLWSIVQQTNLTETPVTLKFNPLYFLKYVNVNVLNVNPGICLTKLGLSFKDDYEKNLEFQKVRLAHFHLSSDD